MPPRAEGEHAQSEARLRLTLEQMPLAFIETDAKGTIIAWNPAAESIFGYTREEVVERMQSEVIVAPVARNQVRGLYQQMTGTRMAQRNINENVRRDGRVIRQSGSMHRCSIRMAACFPSCPWRRSGRSE